METRPKSTLKERLMAFQFKLSNKAGSLINRLSARNKAILLGLFIFITASYCVFLIVERPAENMVGTSRISIVHSRIGNDNPPLDSNDLNQIIGLRKHLDSLGRTATGKAEIENLRKHRPGLLDSLAQIEKQYQSQIKKQRK